MERVKEFLSKTNRWQRVLFLFLLVELRLIPGGRVGFMCNDPALSYPFTGDTISWKWLLGITMFLPLIVMTVVEKKYHSEKPDRSKYRILRWYKEYLFGILVNLTFVQTLKRIIGSPRPHFFDTCLPKEAQICTESEYVSHYTCTKAHWLSQSDQSFPSGHTSMALHAGIFIAYYIHRRSKNPASQMTRVVEAISVAAVIVCSVSRMTDHRHHWWDVLAGAVIGLPILLYTVLVLCKNFEVTNHASPKLEENNLSNPSNSEKDITS